MNYFLPIDLIDCPGFDGRLMFFLIIHIDRQMSPKNNYKFKVKKDYNNKTVNKGNFYSKHGRNLKCNLLSKIEIAINVQIVI